MTNSIMANPIRVLVADDHPIVRNGLVQMVNLADGMAVVAEAATGLEAVEQFRNVRPDVALMDLRMPEMTGVEAIASIRKEFPDACIAILTTYDTDEDIFLGLQAGAKGYLLKDTEIDDLLDAIRTIHAGNKYIPPAVGAKLAERMSLLTLSEREREVAQLMAEGKPNQAISKHLHVSESTVKFHIGNIFTKLGVSDRTQAVLVAIKRGIAKV
ncbi:response regulator transcription factor [cf. Phormidesmis sp. LEGE 11477]|uniref:response regulator n=1 Tax=cf. Phormidesmis sp. LEGE 11477 TaxID=1828680 RepID=UPI001D150B68|nr:response regulator transcription factor [cf. Phormidesmis sp. LEGE 11477]